MRPLPFLCALCASAFIANAASTDSPDMTGTPGLSSSPVSKPSPRSVTFKGIIYPSPIVVHVDDTQALARVALLGKDSTVGEIVPIADIPKVLIDEWRAPQTRKVAWRQQLEQRLGTPILPPEQRKREAFYAEIARSSPEAAKLWRWHDAHPLKPWFIFGKVLTKISDTEVIVTCPEDKELHPHIQGANVYLSAFPEAEHLVDGDPVKALGTLTGQYTYGGNVVPKKTVRAFRNIPKGTDLDALTAK